MQQDLLYDTVVELISAGKTPVSINGRDAYESICEDFCKSFGNIEIPLDTWNLAVELYKKSGDGSLPTTLFSRYLADAKRQAYQPPQQTYEYNYDVWKRSCKKLWQFTTRMISHHLDIKKYMPTDEEAKEVGKRHGMTDHQLSMEIELGGQLLLIKALMCEYKAYKENHILFPYKMGVDKYNEIVWETIH